MEQRVSEHMVFIPAGMEMMKICVEALLGTMPFWLWRKAGLDIMGNTTVMLNAAVCERSTLWVAERRIELAFHFVLSPTSNMCSLSGEVKSS